MTENEMLAQITDLQNRVEKIEASQSDHMAQTVAIKSDTAELLETFNALKGAWTVLNWVGKLAKPLTVVGTLFGAWFAIKGLSK